MRSKFIAIIVLVIVVLAALYMIVSKEDLTSPDPEALKKEVLNSNPQQWETKTDDQSAVTVAVTPIDMLPQSSEWRFNIVMDTHSVELGEDMRDVTFLVDDQGKEYKAIRWEGPGPGGHHREGVLVFNAINPTTSFVELKVMNIGGVPERSSKWNLQ